MQPGFMSSVCPKQTLSELIATAQKHGYTGIEFRSEWGHPHGVELDSTPEQRAAIRRQLADAGIAASCIATSVKFNHEDPAERAKQREILRRYVVLAAEVGAPGIRTFGDPVPVQGSEKLKETLAREADSYAQIDGWAVQHGINILLETHGNLRADHAQAVLEGAHARSLFVNWHIGHHIRHGQSVEEAYPCIRGKVRHVHFSAIEGSEVTDAENRRSLQLLIADGFQGSVSVEVINPEDPDAVLALHIRKYREFIGQ